MDVSRLDALLAELLLAIHMLSGQPVPEALPSIDFVPQRELQERACEGPCEVYGWFPPGRVIYLDDRLDPLKDIWARSIVVHELVHYVQHQEGTFPARGDCESWLDREWEAYDIQLRWLAEQGAPPLLLRRFGSPYWKIRCPDPGSGAN